MRSSKVNSIFEAARRSSMSVILPEDGKASFALAAKKISSVRRRSSMPQSITSMSTPAILLPPSGDRANTTLGSSASNPFLAAQESTGMSGIDEDGTRTAGAQGMESASTNPNENQAALASVRKNLLNLYGSLQQKQGFEEDSLMASLRKGMSLSEGSSGPKRTGDLSFMSFLEKPVQMMTRSERSAFRIFGSLEKWLNYRMGKPSSIFSSSDNTVLQPEFVVCLDMIGIPVGTAEERAKVFALVDTDGDGEITVHELDKILKAMRKRRLDIEETRRKDRNTSEPLIGDLEEEGDGSDLVLLPAQIKSKLFLELGDMKFLPKATKKGYKMFGLDSFVETLLMITFAHLQKGNSQQMRSNVYMKALWLPTYLHSTFNRLKEKTARMTQKSKEKPRRQSLNMRPSEAELVNLDKQQRLQELTDKETNEGFEGDDAREESFTLPLLNVMTSFPEDLWKLISKRQPYPEEVKGADNACPTCGTEKVNNWGTALCQDCSESEISDSTMAAILDGSKLDEWGKIHYRPAVNEGEQPKEREKRETFETESVGTEASRGSLSNIRSAARLLGKGSKSIASIASITMTPDKGAT